MYSGVTIMERKVTIFGNSAKKEDNLLTITAAIEKAGEGKAPILIVFFSDHIDFSWYSVELNKQYSGTIVLGSSSCDVICSGRQSSYGISLIAIMSGVVCECGVIKDVSTYPMQHVDEVKKTINDFPYRENTAIFEMVPSFSRCEELVLDTFKEAMGDQDIPLFGGSSGTEAYSGDEFVALNGRVYTDSCVYVLIHNLNGRIFLYKENMYRPTEKVVTATDVDCDSRTIFELNGRSAATAMAEALNISEQEFRDTYSKHPLGRIRDNDIDIMSPSSVSDDGSMFFYARVFSYTKMAILEIDNLELVWRRTNAAVKANGIRPDFSIAVNCGSRSLQFRMLDKMDAFCETLHENYGEYICGCGFGEQLNNCHYNETLIIGLFE